eukprot:15465432-Alexandrium_andersonii.AAC.1
MDSRRRACHKVAHGAWPEDAAAPASGCADAADGEVSEAKSPDNRDCKAASDSSTLAGCPTP